MAPTLDFTAVEVGALGDTLKQSLLKASTVLAKVVPGLTEESVREMKLTLEEPEHKLRLRVYFLTARKKYVRCFLFLGSTFRPDSLPSYKLSQVQNMEVIQSESILPIRVARGLFGAVLPSDWTGSGLASAVSWFISLLRWR